MESSEAIKRATIGIAILVLVSKGIGFVREMVIAYKFGTGIEYDIYLVAVSIPLVLYELFYAAFTGLIIPNYSRAAAGNRGTGMDHIWAQFNFSLVGAVTFMLLVILTAPQLIRLIAPGMDPRHLPEAVFITRVSAVLIVVAVLGSFFHSVLNAEKKFLLPAASPIAANLVIILAIVIFSGQLSTQAIMYGVVAGYFVQALVMFVPFSKIGLLKYFHARIIEPHLGKFIFSAVAILAIETAAKLFAIVDRYFASYMEPGLISALGYAYLLAAFPIAIFAYALSTAIFPYLSDAFAVSDEPRSSHLLSRGISVSLLISLPASVLYWVFAEEFVIILFQRGAFDTLSVEYTSGFLKYFAWAFPGQFILYIMSRAYYAAKRLDILVVQVVLMILAKIALTALGVKYFGAAGLPLATVAGYSLGAVILLSLANRFLTRLDAKRLMAYFGKVLVATALSAVTAFWLNRVLMRSSPEGPAMLLLLAISLAIAAGVFLATTYLMKISDITELFGTKRRNS